MVGLRGVANNGEVLGIDGDLALVENSHDRFKSRIRSKLSDMIGKEFGGLIEIQLESLKGKTVCIVKVKKAKKWAFMQGRFFIRMDNQTQELPVQQAVEYMNTHDDRSP